MLLAPIKGLPRSISTCCGKQAYAHLRHPECFQKAGTKIRVRHLKINPIAAPMREHSRLYLLLIERHLASIQIGYLVSAKAISTLLPQPLLNENDMSRIPGRHPESYPSQSKKRHHANAHAGSDQINEICYTWLGEGSSATQRVTFM
jgi:hypothetical protein